MTTLTRPTAIGDQPVYSVTWTKRSPRGWKRKALVHGVMGRECRITLCSIDFIDVADPYVDAEITCLTCLAHLGELYGDR